VVEDDEGIREGLGELLSDSVEFCGVSSVPAALQSLESDRFDLVIADLSLGEQRLGGKAVAEAAQRHGVPVAILSASPKSDVARALGGIKPDAIVSKPFQLDEIEALVQRFNRGSQVPAT
jgi:DNA-binding response OmpR family regulator